MRELEKERKENKGQIQKFIGDKLQAKKKVYNEMK